MGTFYHLALGLALASLVLAAPQEPASLVEESRGKIRRAVLPFLIGIVLKASTLVPLKLMIMTFVALMALLTSKLGVLIASIVALHQYYQTSSSHPPDLYSTSPYFAVTSPAQIPASIANQIPPSGNEPTSNQGGNQAYVRRVHVAYG